MTRTVQGQPVPDQLSCLGFPHFLPLRFSPSQGCCSWAAAEASPALLKQLQLCREALVSGARCCVKWRELSLTCRPQPELGGGMQNVLVE